MKKISLILPVVLLVASCGQGAEEDPVVAPEPQEKPGELVKPIRLSNESWTELMIDSHPWINQATYYRKTNKWVINESPDTLLFIIRNEEPLEGEVSSIVHGSKASWSLNINSFLNYNRRRPYYYFTSSGDFFFLYHNGSTRCYGFRKKIDTTRVLVLDTIDQTEDPDAGDYDQ